tara:strand:- start:59 stop:370 length:312 start_codon:yes stop_codon:yes gene_type:complete
LKYVIDIDGTICKEVGSVADREPFSNRIRKINQLYDNGHTIVYITARGLKSGRGESYYRPITEKQLKLWGCKYHELAFKPHDADLFIDDKAMNDKEFFSGTEI